jgi:hypothetical protein
VVCLYAVRPRRSAPAEARRGSLTEELGAAPRYV